MQLTETDFGGAVPIDGYGPGFFRIGGERIEGGVLILPGGRVRRWTGWDDRAALGAAAREVDVVLVGTGAATAHPPADFRDWAAGIGIGVEPMASPAACRTYNVLLAEGRRIAAALLPV